MRASRILIGRSTGVIESRVLGMLDTLDGCSLHVCPLGDDDGELLRLLKEAVFGLLMVEAPAASSAVQKLTSALHQAAEPDLQVLVLVEDAADLATWRSQLQFLGHRLLVLRQSVHDLELQQVLTLLARKRHLEQAATLMAVAHADEEPAEVEAPRDLILVVDDDDTIAQIMAQVLATHQHATVTATNADEAWRLWRRHRDRIRLVITDISMPGGANGIELARVIHQDAPDMPVIYTSGQRARNLHESLKSGVNYLPKPFGMNDLLRVVQLNLEAPPPQ